MKRNSEKEPMTKKGYIIWLSVSLGLFAIFFAMLLIAATLQDNGVSPEIYNPIGFSSFAFIIASLVVLFAQYGRAREYEVNVKIAKVDSTEPSVFENVTKESLKAALTKMNFKEKDEYYYKRSFSFFKDYINYFIRFADAIDTENSIDSETSKIDAKNYTNKNKCLILILSLDNITCGDIEKMKEFNKAFIISEYINPLMTDSAVCILLEKNSNKAYIIENANHAISIYSHGIRLVKKLIND